jgi:hypothetical protein
MNPFSELSEEEGLEVNRALRIYAHSLLRSHAKLIKEKAIERLKADSTKKHLKTFRIPGQHYLYRPVWVGENILVKNSYFEFIINNSSEEQRNSEIESIIKELSSQLGEPVYFKDIRWDGYEFTLTKNESLNRHKRLITPKAIRQSVLENKNIESQKARLKKSRK